MRNERHLAFSRIRNGTKQSAKDRDIEFELTAADIESVFKDGSYKCAYCGMTLDQSYQLLNQRLELDRIDSHRGYVKDNVHLACAICNRFKGSFLRESEVRRLGKIIFKAITRQCTKRNTYILFNLRLQFVDNTKREGFSLEEAAYIRKERS